MKLTDRDVESLIKEMEKSDASGQGQVNYKDFLKFSYLCLMYLNHFDLEFQLRELDKEKKGLVTVAQLDQILQSKDSFAFPPTALDEVFTEMLGQNIQNVDRNCVIKIDAFMESLRDQFD